jgi:hypothetical protein
LSRSGKKHGRHHGLLGCCALNLFNDAARSSGYVGSNGRMIIMNGKVYGRKRYRPVSWYYRGIRLEEARKPRRPLVRISRVPAEVRTGHLPNTNQKLYRFSQLAR